MKKKIYQKGINFKCQGSANCCVSRGSYGFVYLSNIDLKKLARFFSISINTFKFMYCDKTNGFIHLKEKNKNGDCLLLKDKKCSVYAARPIQCKTWPFWPENMNSKSWNQNVVNFCPGIGKGNLISSNTIEKLLKIDLENEKNIINEKLNT